MRDPATGEHPQPAPADKPKTEEHPLAPEVTKPVNIPKTPATPTPTPTPSPTVVVSPFGKPKK